MKNWKTFKNKLLKNPIVVEKYNKLSPRYQVISSLIEARLKKGLTQRELAVKIGTKQSAIARVESGKANPSLKFLEKMVAGIGSKLVIQVQ